MSAIDDKYTSLGGAGGFLGAPTTPETTAEDGVGRIRHFQRGSIYWTPKTGAHEVHGLIRNKWEALDWQKGFLGYPLTDETVASDKRGRYNHFQGGSIYWTPETGAHEVHGLIRQKWADLGWEKSHLGYPLTDETKTPDTRGRYNHFQGGSIYWTPETGAHEVRGAIRQKWADLGWEKSFLGYPLTDETVAPDGRGRFNKFQGGSIRWTPETGAYSVEELLTQFKQSTAAGVWPRISKQALLIDMGAKIEDSLKVNQHQTNLCGPAAIVFELVSKYPGRYIQMCRELYETGKLTCKTKKVAPSTTTLGSRVPTSTKGISVADWMLMAAMRDTENALFDVDDSSGPIDLPPVEWTGRELPGTLPTGGAEWASVSSTPASSS